MNLRERFFSEPLVWFLLFGAAIFVVDQSARKDAELEIIIDQSLLDRISVTWQASYGRPPTEQEMTSLIDDHIVEEMLFREALALGLDQQDQIIRRRLTQKMRFLSEDALAAETPEDTRLREWFAARKDEYVVPARISFRHVYVNPDKPESALEERLAAIVSALESNADAGALGDLFLLPLSYQDAPLTRISADLGSTFAEALSALPIGAWSGPVESAHGLHFVRIEQRRESAIPPFEQLRQKIERDFSDAQRAQADREFIDRLRAKYSILDDSRHDD